MSSVRRPMKPREVKLSRRVALDYMLIGVVIGGGWDVISDRIEPAEMLTDVGRRLMTAVKEKDREAFKAVLESRQKIAFEENERIIDGVIRAAKESNTEQYAYAVADSMAEQLQNEPDIDRLIDLLERSTNALKASREEKEAVYDV